LDDLTSQHEGVVEGCESIQTGPKECVKLNTVRDYKCMKMCGCYLPFSPIRQPETAVTFYVSFSKVMEFKHGIGVMFWGNSPP